MAYNYLNLTFGDAEVVNEFLYKTENKLGLDCSDYEIARAFERLNFKGNKILLYPFDALKSAVELMAEDAGYNIVNLSVNEHGIEIEVEEEYDEDEEDDEE